MRIFPHLLKAFCRAVNTMGSQGPPMNFPTNPNLPLLPTQPTKKTLTWMTSLIFPTDLPIIRPKRSQSQLMSRRMKVWTEARRLWLYLNKLVEVSVNDWSHLGMLMTLATPFLEKWHLPVSLQLGLTESLLNATMRVTTQMALVILWLTPSSEDSPVAISAIKDLVLTPRSENKSVTGEIISFLFFFFLFPFCIYVYRIWNLWTICRCSYVSVPWDTLGQDMRSHKSRGI